MNEYQTVLVGEYFLSLASMANLVRLAHAGAAWLSPGLPTLSTGEDGEPVSYLGRCILGVYLCIHGILRTVGWSRAGEPIR